MSARSGTSGSFGVSIETKEDPKDEMDEDEYTLHAVQMFRDELGELRTRLEMLCAQWFAFRQSEPINLLQNGGADIIDGTIGQTKLLVTKKFKQLEELMERCESGVTGVGALVFDGTEKTRPIKLADLEGFWSILNLQVQNVDQRFEDLLRWQNNDWKDPDAALGAEKRPSKKLPTPNPVVAHVKPNTKLRALIRKAKAERRRIKNPAELDFDVCIYERPSQRNESQPVAVNVKDSIVQSDAVSPKRAGQGSARTPSSVQLRQQQAINKHLRRYAK